MTTKSTRRSIASPIIRSNARRVAPRIRSTGACSYRSRPRSGLSRWISAAWRNVTGMGQHRFRSMSMSRDRRRRSRSIDQVVLEPLGGERLGLALVRADDQGRGAGGGLDQGQAAAGAEYVGRRVEAVG